MKINDIFSIEQYDEAYKFVIENLNTTIKDLGNKQYQIVEIPSPSLEEIAIKKRIERDYLLAYTDRFTSIPDYPITEIEREQYKKYRQYLRDIPQQKTFPNIRILDFNTWLTTQENI